MHIALNIVFGIAMAKPNHSLKGDTEKKALINRDIYALILMTQKKKKTIAKEGSNRHPPGLEATTKLWHLRVGG